MNWLLLAGFLGLGFAQQCPQGSSLLPSDATYCMVVVDSDDRDYPTSSRRCASAVGRLSRVRSAFDNSLLFSLAQSVQLSGNEVYIGIRKVNGTWRYDDDEYNIDRVTYTNWAKNEPVDVENNTCAVLNLNDGKWHATGCDPWRPHACDIPTLHDPLFCTDKINADIVFMIDATGTDNQTRMIHDVLWGVNTALRTRWWTYSGCASADLSKQTARVTGVVYFDDTWIGTTNPQFCKDAFFQVVDNMQRFQSQSHFVTNMTLPVDIVRLYTQEQPCPCRRTDPEYGTKQIMIWIPVRDKYFTTRNVTVAELNTWDHYLWPIMLSKDNATEPMWTDPKMKQIPMADRLVEFIPTQILTLWRFLCDIANSSGETPLPPYI